MRARARARAGVLGARRCHTRAALDQGFGELGLEAVVIALPYTRSPTRAVARFGFVPDGEVPYDGTSFRQYRLTREAWAAVTWWPRCPDARRPTLIRRVRRAGSPP
jgi:hypothetical protein